MVRVNCLACVGEAHLRHTVDLSGGVSSFLELVTLRAWLPASPDQSHAAVLWGSTRPARSSEGPRACHRERTGPCRAPSAPLVTAPADGLAPRGRLARITQEAASIWAAPHAPGCVGGGGGGGGGRGAERHPGEPGLRGAGGPGRRDAAPGALLRQGHPLHAGHLRTDFRPGLPRSSPAPVPGVRNAPDPAIHSLLCVGGGGSGSAVQQASAADAEWISAGDCSGCSLDRARSQCPSGCSAC